MELLNLQHEFREAMQAAEKIALIKQPANLVIHQNTMQENLLQMLVSTYPLITKLLGLDFFEQTAREYIKQYPSRSGNLNEYGEYFARFLNDYAPLKNLPYLYEVAMFEWTSHILQFAAEASLFSRQSLKNKSEADYDTLVFQLNPAAAIMHFHFPILAILELCRGKTEDVNLDAPGVYLLLLQEKGQIKLTELSEIDYLFLSSLQENKSLKEVLAILERQGAARDLAALLEHWMEQKMIIGVN